MKVDVYSTNTCPPCLMLKQWLMLSGIPFVNHDVSVDREAARYLVTHYGNSVPVIEINGIGITGFRKEMIQELINKSLEME